MVNVSQRFPNCGPRTPGVREALTGGSAGNYCFLVECREKMCKFLHTVTSKNLLLKSLLFFSSESDYYIIISF